MSTRLKLPGPAFRPLHAAVAQQYAAAVTEPDTQDHGREPREPPPADPLGDQRQEAARDPRQAGARDDDGIPRKPCSAGDGVCTRQVVDADEGRDGDRLSHQDSSWSSNEVAAAYGPVTVNSTCRNPSRNAAVGGARHSYHLSGSAADFRIHGNARAVHAHLSSNRSVGGLKHYGGGLFHIDVGPRRTW